MRDSENPGELNRFAVGGGVVGLRFVETIALPSIRHGCNPEPNSATGSLARAPDARENSGAIPHATAARQHMGTRPTAGASLPFCGCLLRPALPEAREFCGSSEASNISGTF
jgi:hypothetical protein